jgi:probable phosphoglycerate mutase
MGTPNDRHNEQRTLRRSTKIAVGTQRVRRHRPRRPSLDPNPDPEDACLAQNDGLFVPDEHDTRVTQAPSVWIVRHGETEWSRDGRHTSVTDLELTVEGEAEAASLALGVAALDADLVLCSPRARARRTAEIAGLTPYEVREDLREWDYGELEGLTTPQIRVRHPSWTVWDGPWPGGESADEVTERADLVVRTLRGSGAARVAVVGHGHFSRAVAARWVGAPVSVGRWLDLDTGTLSELGWAREVPVLRHWNVPIHHSRAG